jgi:small-conductance mechanosensitive channel
VAALGVNGGKKAFDEEGIEIPYPHRVIVTRGAKAIDLPETTGKEK